MQSEVLINAWLEVTVTFGEIRALLCDHLCAIIVSIHFASLGIYTPHTR